MWIKWITWLISPVFFIFVDFFLWITFSPFSGCPSVFFDKIFSLCKLTVICFSSTLFIHISMWIVWIAFVDNRFCYSTICKTNLSTAWETPLFSLENVIKSAFFLTSSVAFSIATATEAACSMERSFSESPQAIV